MAILQHAVQENRKIRETQEKIKRAKEAKEKAEREKQARQARQRALVDITTGIENLFTISWLVNKDSQTFKFIQDVKVFLNSREIFMNVRFYS